jgi:CBS domain-containing protein
MKVREVMIDRVTSCNSNTNLATVAGLMWENDCGVLPVLDDGGKVVGMITDRDTCIAVAHKAPTGIGYFGKRDHVEPSLCMPSR